MLILNATFVLTHPLPDTFEKSFTANGMAVCSLLCQQSFDHCLCSNTRVIFSRHPERVIAFHTMIANKNIFDSGGDVQHPVGGGRPPREELAQVEREGKG